MASESDSVAQLQRKLFEVQNEVGQLKQEKRQMEEDFQQKRAKFKEMYYAKENSLQEQNTQLLQAKAKINDFESLVESLKNEIEDIKVVASVSENTKQEAVENLRSNHQQEIESLQRVLEDSMEEQRNELLEQFEMERKQWESEKNELEQTVIKLEECLESVEAFEDDNAAEGKAKQEQQSGSSSSNSSGGGDDFDSNAHQQPPQLGDFSHHVSVLEKENDTLKRKMHEVCRMLEREQCEHDILKQTWTVEANNDETSHQPSPCLLIKDLTFIKEMLTEEQWSLLKDKRSKNMAELSSTNSALSNEKQQNKEDVENATTAGQNARKKRAGDVVDGAQIRRQGSNSASVIGASTSGSVRHDATSIITEDDQQRSQECGDEADGKEAEEVTIWKERYERERSLRVTLDESVMQMGEEAKQQIADLTKKLTTFQQILEDIKDCRLKKEINDDKRINQLLRNSEQMKENMTIVSRERDSLRRLYDKHRHQVDQEVAVNTLEGLRGSLRKYKEALVAAQMEKADVENKLQSEMSFLKSELSAIQHSKDQIEKALSGEIELLQAKLSSLQNMRNQFEVAINVKNDLKMKVEQQQMTTDSIRSKSKEVIKSLRDKLAAELSNKQHAEEQLASSKNQLRSLQDSLQTSEQVQRDFVKLSQSLQVQLENIRVKEENKLKEEQQSGDQQQTTISESPKNSNSFP